jgi:hypothetical protein
LFGLFGWVPWDEGDLVAITLWKSRKIFACQRRISAAGQKPTSGSVGPAHALLVTAAAFHTIFNEVGHGGIDGKFSHFNGLYAKRLSVLGGTSSDRWRYVEPQNSWTSQITLVMHMMKPSIAMAAALLVAASNAGASQFSSVIDAMVIGTSAAHTNNDWKATTKIAGVRWKWQYHESGAHDHTMVGSTKVGKSRNPNIGATEVLVSGTRSMISPVTVRVANESLGIEALGVGKATKIHTSCDESSGSSNVEFYKFERAGFKPLFVSLQSSWGAGGSGTVELGVSYDIADALSIHPVPCAVR